jgi:ATP-dependent protease HslVU (ClpYQ) peptidase subunit
MTTIAVVRKEGVAAVAADTLTKWGSAKESALYIANHEKILKVGESLIAVTGSATFKLILRDYFNDAADVRLSNPQEIFRTWNRLHSTLKQRYYLMPEEDKEDALESSRMDVLIANPHGIFGVSGHRTVQEFSRFYAYGSGSDYALGALYSAYDDAGRDAEQLARHAVEAAAEFDDCTAAPITSFSVRLAKP